MSYLRINNTKSIKNKNMIDSILTHLESLSDSNELFPVDLILDKLSIQYHQPEINFIDKFFRCCKILAYKNIIKLEWNHKKQSHMIALLNNKLKFKR